jgi:hypothetical protein
MKAWLDLTVPDVTATEFVKVATFGHYDIASFKRVLLEVSARDGNLFHLRKI